ncbi:hypothetical protein BD626DRAFT_634422 [Schizophyllum amplum]|uniref:Uncharacterized protein n=1 Tax=Schizophyllum amplum TaxID=97359 RepID=A0A550BZB1_9AGAR|nr:hypothetical protein BD626DRAFT_634422 [Auriculariopsis ampla]
MPVPQATLNDLPNELLLPITQQSTHWEQLPPRLSAYGVLSRVNRRLRAFALPHYFSQIRIPTILMDGACTLRPRPLVNLLGLLHSDRWYKRHIRNIQIGRASYPYEVDAGADVQLLRKVVRYAWELLDIDRSSPWNWDLDSFTSFQVGCTPTTIRILSPSRHLTSLSMYWLGPDFPDLSPFPQLETLRLRGTPVLDPTDRGKSVLPCPSLRTLHIRGDVDLPGNFEKDFGELYPGLRVFAAAETTLTVEQALCIMADRKCLEEVSVELGQCRLSNVLDVASGLIDNWTEPMSGLADHHDPVYQSIQNAWRKLRVTAFAFTRQMTRRYPLPSYTVTSLSLKLCDNYAILDDQFTPILEGLPVLDYLDVRHLALSFIPHRCSFSLELVDEVDDLFMAIGRRLSALSSLETFTLTFDLQCRLWLNCVSEEYDEIMDYGQQPSGQAIESAIPHPYLLRHTLLQSNTIDEVEATLGAASQMLGRPVTIDDEDVNLDALWVERHEREFTQIVWGLGRECSKLREFNWYAMDRWPGVSWAWKIGRNKEGGVRCVHGKPSWPGSLRGEPFPFRVLVGQELCAAKSAWRGRH